MLEPVRIQETVVGFVLREWTPWAQQGEEY